MKKLFIFLVFILVVSFSNFTYSQDCGMIQGINWTSPGLMGPISQPQYDNGTCTTAKTISAANGNHQKVILTNGQTCALTFTQPTSGTAIVILKITQSAVSTYNGVISGGKWPSGSPPVITASNAAVDIVQCYLDGSNAYCAVMGQDLR